MAFTVAQFGSASLASLGLLMVTFWGTCAVFVVAVLGLVARLSGFNIFRLIRMIRDELLIIVGTSSSETGLPRQLAKLQAAGASRQVVGMVIPTGYSFNLDGTLHLPHPRRALHRAGRRAGHPDRDAHRPAGADDP
ncbi:MAG: cation:dicarboxylate symporter family transporter, partial [Solirubrobacteraceae bacterium]